MRENLKEKDKCYFIERHLKFKEKTEKSKLFSIKIETDYRHFFMTLPWKNWR